MQDPFATLGPEWFYFNFTYDEIPDCMECTGSQLVREITSSGRARLAGLVLCDATRFGSL